MSKQSRMFSDRKVIAEGLLEHLSEREETEAKLRELDQYYGRIADEHEDNFWRVSRFDRQTDAEDEGSWYDDDYVAKPPQKGKTFYELFVEQELADWDAIGNDDDF